MDWVEWIARLFTSLGSIVGAVAALGGLIGMIGRDSRVPRARRRVLRAAELEGRAHSSLREQYAALHREQSARYLALVESRIDSEPVATAVAAIAALLSAFAILVMTAWNGGNSGVWSETLATVIPFAIAYAFFLWMVLSKYSSQRWDFVRGYRAYVGHGNTNTPDPGEHINRLIRKLGDKAPNRMLRALAVAFSVPLLAVVGHAVGRSFTECGRAMKEADGQGLWLATTMTILVLLVAVTATVILLFPKLPCHGESLQAGTTAESTPADPAHGDPSRAPDSGPSASGSPPQR